MINASTGRVIIFTPERIEQIKNLVERGMSREQIAETIGSTVGSLAVTCSKHGISLRQPSAKFDRPKIHKSEGQMDEDQVAKFEISIGARKITCEVPLRAFVELCFEAQMANVSLGEIIATRLEGG